MRIKWVLALAALLTLSVCSRAAFADGLEKYDFKRAEIDRISFGIGLPWVHGEEVLLDKVKVWDVGAGLEKRIFKGLYGGYRFQANGLRPWKDNDRNGLDAILNHNLRVTDVDTESQFELGWQFNSCRLFVRHANFPTRTVPQGRYHTSTGFGCSASLGG